VRYLKATCTVKTPPAYSSADNTMDRSPRLNKNATRLLTISMSIPDLLPIERQSDTAVFGVAGFGVFRADRPLFPETVHRHRILQAELHQVSFNFLRSLFRQAEVVFAATAFICVTFDPILV